MIITIQGSDYSSSLDAIHPLTIERKLNEPSACQLWLTLPIDGSRAIPLRNQSLVITGDDGTKYFTGYIATSPLMEYAGLSLGGPRYRISIRALSDELLMDQLPVASTMGAAGMTAGQLMTSLVMHTRSATLGVGGLSLDSSVSNFTAGPGASWSESAGQIASQARAAYRALGGVLDLSQIPVAIHALNENDGTLNPENLALMCGNNRTLANDITVCGDHEPIAFVTEYFQGDGISTQFNLGDDPFFQPASKTKVIEDRFSQSAIDLSAWSIAGGAGYFSLGARGLVMNGGNGVDGETLLSWIDSVELGGTLLLEASGITLGVGSSGILAGLFVGLDTLAGCVAGFQAQVQPGTGAVSLQPVVLGNNSGANYPVNPANQYTLRVRLHCPECVRSLAVYPTTITEKLSLAGRRTKRRQDFFSRFRNSSMELRECR
jgi:hypothetical protein